MTNLRAVLEERLGLTNLYTSEEVKKLCEKSFDAGQAYVQGSHKDFIQTHKNKEEFIKSLNL